MTVEMHVSGGEVARRAAFLLEQLGHRVALTEVGSGRATSLLLDPTNEADLVMARRLVASIEAGSGTRQEPTAHGLSAA
ncbi:MAG: hypothetical protein WB767_06000 [Nocardioides sp.]